MPQESCATAESPPTYTAPVLLLISFFINQFTVIKRKKNEYAFLNPQFFFGWLLKSEEMEGRSQNQASGDKAYYSFLATAFWCPSCGDTLCSTRRPERVSEIPTHHSVIWASPKISCPRKACKEPKGWNTTMKFTHKKIRCMWRRSGHLRKI